MESVPCGSPAFHDLEQLTKAADLAAVLTRQLLGSGRRQVLMRTNVIATDVVADLIKLLRPLIGEHIDLESDLDQEILHVHADSTLLQQMLLNLCINARDAMPDGGRLWIGTRQVWLDQAGAEQRGNLAAGWYVRLTISDTGCGMTPEVRKRIFEPCFTTKEIGKGTGLGLAMVYGVVQQHEGHIEVESILEQGSSFHVFLPTARSAAVVAPCTPVKRSRGGQEIILVAEDEPLVRDISIRTLNAAGYTTLVATDGEEALELFESRADEISLAVLDMVMPKLNGREVYQRMQLLRPDVRVVFCSGYDPDSAQAGFVTDAGLRLIEKPFDPQALRRTIREALDDEPCLELTHA